MIKPKFYSLIEAGAAYKALKSDVDGGRLSHAYLLCSPDTMQLTSLSRLFCSYALYSGDNETVYSGRHADVHVFPVEGADGTRKETVYTADIDELISGLYIRPSAGSKKFYIIDFGETMNAACQNKLLKTLEEPPPSAHIIINASAKTALLPTVVSRCKSLEPPVFTKDEILSGLKDIFGENEKLDFAASAARGSLDAAYKMAGDKKYSQIFDTALVSLLTLENSASVLSSSARLNNYKDSLNTFLGFFEIIFRDIFIKNSGQNELLMLKCYEGDIDKLAVMFSCDAALAVMPLILKAQKRIKNHGNALSVIDELLFGIAYNRAKYKV